MTEPTAGVTGPTGSPAIHVPYAPPEPDGPGVLTPLVAGLPVTVAPPRRGRASGNALLLLAGLVAVGGIAFAVGRSTAGVTTSDVTGFGPQGAPNASFVPGDGGPGGPGGLAGERTVTGTVSSVDGGILTITTAGGDTVTIDASGADYHSQAAASSSDVTAGSTVQVTVSGFGVGAAPGASGAPNASAQPGTGDAGLTATDVTIVTP